MTGLVTTGHLTIALYCQADMRALARGEEAEAARVKAGSGDQTSAQRHTPHTPASQLRLLHFEITNISK